jgi:hypothetical protein
VNCAQHSHLLDRCLQKLSKPSLLVFPVRRGQNEGVSAADPPPLIEVPTSDNPTGA